MEGFSRHFGTNNKFESIIRDYVGVDIDPSVGHKEAILNGLGLIEEYKRVV